IKRDIDLPSQSDVTGNLIIGYETNGFMLRLAANYKSDYLLEVSDVADERGDIHQASHTQLDLSSAYDLTNHLKLTFDISNLTDEPYYAYQHQEKYNAQYEEYGPTYRFGISYTGFLYPLYSFFTPGSLRRSIYHVVTPRRTTQHIN